MKKRVSFITGINHTKETYMFKKLSLILFFSLAIQGQTHAADNTNTDILNIFDQFITSGAAVSRCETPAKEILKNYIDNLQMVSVLVSKKIKDKNPEYLEENISKVMNDRSGLITKKVNQIIDDKSCKDAEIQEIIERFYKQAKWKPAH